MSISAVGLGLTEEETQIFNKLYDKVIQSLDDLNYNSLTNMETINKWMITVANSNVRDKLDRCPMVASAYKCLAVNPTAEKMEQAFVLDWCLEFFNAANIMAYNIENGTSGISGWHNLQNVGMMAVNDTLILKGLGYNAMKILFGNQTAIHTKLEDLRRETFDKYVLGRGLYEKMKRAENVSEAITADRYRQVVGLTEGYSTFYLPVMFALTLTEKDVDVVTEKYVNSIMLDIGYYYQIQRDYIKMFVNDNNTEITEGEIKLNWLFVKTVEKFRTKEKALYCLLDFVEQGSLPEIKKIYKENGILKNFIEEKNDLKDIIRTKIDTFERDTVGYNGLVKFLRLLVY